MARQTFHFDAHFVLRKNPCASTVASRPAERTWNYDRTEVIADGVVHALGVSLGLVGAIMILIVVSKMRVVESASVTLYSVALLMMLGLSAAYNMWPISRTKWILRRFDHSAIYMLIAGTYTPFIAHMSGGFASASFLIGVWLTAVVGIVLKLLLPGRFNGLAIVLYLLLGWSGALAYKLIAATLPSLSLWLLFAGGILYSTGLIFHAWKSLRFQNAIWHSFVLLAACCHYMAVLKCVAFAQ